MCAPNLARRGPRFDRAVRTRSRPRAQVFPNQERPQGDQAGRNHKAEQDTGFADRRVDRRKDSEMNCGRNQRARDEKAPKEPQNNANHGFKRSRIQLQTDLSNAAANKQRVYATAENDCHDGNRNARIAIPSAWSDRISIHACRIYWAPVEKYGRRWRKSIAASGSAPLRASMTIPYGGAPLLVLAEGRFQPGELFLQRRDARILLFKHQVEPLDRRQGNTSGGDRGDAPSQSTKRTQAAGQPS